jgi:hypothetical protein
MPSASGCADKKKGGLRRLFFENRSSTRRADITSEKKGGLHRLF